MAPQEKVDPKIGQVGVKLCDTKDPEKANLEKQNLEPPKDRFCIVYLLFFILGLVHFLPWSFFSAATGYWMYKFRNTTINETNSEFRTDLQASFNAALQVTFQVSNIVFLILSILFGRYFRVRVRLIGVLVTILIIFIVLTVFVKVDTDEWQEEFFGVAMVLTSGVNAMNAILSVTMYTVMSNFPRYYLAPYLTGGGLSKIFTSGLQILSLTLGLSTTSSALVYFSMGVFVVLVGLLALLLTSQNSFYLYHTANFREDKKEKVINFRAAFDLFKKIWLPVLIMGLFFLQTDASPVALVVSEGEGNGPWNDLYFIPTITYLLTGTGDLIGRVLAFRYSPDWRHTTWLIIAIVRTFTLIPLFMLCNAQPRHHLPVLLPHDYQYIILSIASSLSGGYLFTLTYYKISLMVSKDELKNAYHVNLLILASQMALLSFVSLVSVKLL